MELALIVYLVATLGAVKGFVTSWWSVIFVLFMVSYIIVKLKLIQFVQNKLESGLISPKWKDLSEDRQYTLTSDIGSFHAGDKVYVNKFTTHGYIGINKLSSDQRITPVELENALKNTETVFIQETVTPLDANINKLKYVAITMLCLHLMLPTEKTLQYAAGAYLIQTTYESDFVQEAGSLAGKAVTNQLRKWAESNPDIDTLLESVETTKDKAEAVVK